MRWAAVAAMLILGIGSLMVIWRAYRSHPRGELVRRGWVGFVLGLGFSTARWVSGWDHLFWVFALLSLAAYTYGAVYMVRFIREERRDKLDRWRAKGAPPPLGDPEERQ
jgi:hypothetical protein